MNMSLMDDFMGQLDAGRRKHCNPEQDYFMHILAVDPAHHRKGLGSMLLAHVLAKADQEGAKCYIEASAMGLPVYVRHGWEVVDEIVVDMEKHGCPGGIVRQKCLMRQPQKSLA